MAPEVQMADQLIGKDCLVEISYQLSDAETGTTLDSSTAGEPLTYVHGRGQLLPGLEQALEDRSAGDELSITVPASEGYGEHHPEMVMTVPRDRLGFDIREGGVVQAQLPDGRSHYLMIVDIQEDQVILDGNHPLAGRSLHFDVTVEGVREATPEEVKEAES
jgi:FKBP-type peptidyl-prolyl cis-trans isomerase SlyD